MAEHDSMGTIFLFHVEFAQLANPPASKSRFEADLMAFLKARRLCVLLGQQGGMTNTYGVVHRKRWGVKEKDRIALAEWIKCQAVHCTVRLGKIEEETCSTDLVREITECVFEVNNLAKDDKILDAAHEAEQRMQAYEFRE